MNESDVFNPAVFAPWRVPSTSTTFCSNIQPAWYCTRGSRVVTLPSSDSPTASRAADSGLRLYGDPVVLPPAYTQD